MGPGIAQEMAARQPFLMPNLGVEKPTKTSSTILSQPTEPRPSPSGSRQNCVKKNKAAVTGENEKYCGDDVPLHQFGFASWTLRLRPGGTSSAVSTLHLSGLRIRDRLFSGEDDLL